MATTKMDAALNILKGVEVDDTEQVHTSYIHIQTLTLIPLHCMAKRKEKIVSMIKVSSISRPSYVYLQSNKYNGGYK